MKIPPALLGLVTLLPLAAHSEGWKWDNDLIPDLGFDLDSAQVIKVTTLDPTAKGGLAKALWADGPRIIVFEVGGVIDLGMDDITIKNSQVVIAGQTAPGPGITLVRGTIAVGASQALIQHIAIRPGDAGQPKGSGWGPDGLSTLGDAHDLWVDHCSITWSVDENLSASSYDAPAGQSARRITFRDCIIAEGLNNSSHKKGPHSKGTLVMDGTKEVAIVRCLYAANVERNPLFKPDTNGVVVNCLIAGPGQRSIHVTAPESDNASLAQVAVVGNVVRFAPGSKRTSAILEGNGQWYAEDNFGKNVEGEPVPLIRNGEVTLARPPVWPQGLKPIPSSEVIAAVAAHVGSRPSRRDPIDQRIVTEAVEARNRIIDSQEEVGGYPKPEPVHRPLEVPAKGRRDWLRKLALEVGN